MHKIFHVVFAVVISIFFLSSCGDKECKCPSVKNTLVENKVGYKVDSIKDIDKVRLYSDSEGFPLIGAVQNWESLYLYKWNGKDWSKYLVLNDVTICDFDMIGLDNSQVLFVVSIKNDEMTNSCVGEEVLYDYENQKRIINNQIEINNPIFVTLKKINSLPYLAYINGDTLSLFLGFKVKNEWTFQLVDDGVRGGIGKGNIYYEPKIISNETGDISIAYYEMREPIIKIATLSFNTGRWSYSSPPIQNSDIEVSPDFSAVYLPWGGIGIFFHNMVDGDLYYSFEVTGWEIGRVYGDSSSTGFNPYGFVIDSRILVVYYDLSLKQLKLAKMLPPYFNEAGVSITPWRVDTVPLSGIELVYDVKYIGGKNNKKLSIVFFDKSDDWIKFTKLNF